LKFRELAYPIPFPFPFPRSEARPPFPIRPFRPPLLLAVQGGGLTRARKATAGCGNGLRDAATGIGTA
jgi:hypothetical protein